MASMPNFRSSTELNLVSNEDTRIRTLMHDSEHAKQPEVVHSADALATLVLPARSAAYTVTDLVQHGAVVMLSSNVALLQENVFVASGATLSLGVPALTTLYMASSSSGFTSIVGWGGSLSFTGTAAQPFTIMSYDQARKSAVADKGAGRPYIREIGATMTFSYVRVSALGFWSGRTGGVAWTGTSRASSKGSAVDSTFTGDTYGAFVSRGKDVTFSGDRFESNELDGLHIHRYSVGIQVISSSAVRNGGSGFLVDRATTDTLLRGDVSQHNAANGYLFDGRPLVSGASASGGSNTPSSGTILEGSSATGNGHTSVLIEGGTGTVVKSDQFCSPTTAIALRTGATNAVLTGNYIDCDPRSAISVGPSAPGTVVFGNIVVHPGIGMLIRTSGSVSLYNNRIIGATVFGVSARGATSKVGGVGNAISGTGDRAVDVRTDASVSSLSGTDTSGWAHNARVTFISYLEFHPLASLWLGILVVILLAAGWSFRRKLPDHPYPASVRRMHELPAPGESSVAMEAHPSHLQFAAGRPTAIQRALGRPAARPARPPAAPLNASGWGAAGRPQPMTRQQPTYQPALSGPRPAYQDPALSGPRPAYQDPALSGPRPAYQDPALSGPRPAYQDPALSGPRPAYQDPALSAPRPAYQDPALSAPRPAYQDPALSGPRPGYQELARREPPYHQPPRHQPAYQEPPYGEPVRHQPAYQQPAYGEPARQQPAYQEPPYREPAPGPQRRHEPMAEPAPTGWDLSARDVARWQRPAPAQLSAAPSRTSSGWPELPAHRGGPVDDRVTRAQQALPSETNRPSGRERPADPNGDDVRATHPIPKGLWE